MVRNRHFLGGALCSLHVNPIPPHRASLIRLLTGVLSLARAYGRVTVVSLSFDLMADGPRVNPAVSMRWAIGTCAQAEGRHSLDGTAARLASILYGAFPTGAESNSVHCMMLHAFICNGLSLTA